MGARILVIDDENEIRRLLEIGFKAHGFGFFEAASGEAGLKQAVMIKPDLIVLDMGLPDMDGLTVIERVREWSSVPIIILSVREHESDKVKALDNGADDYLTKPFGMAELLARVRVALRHQGGQKEEPVLAAGELEMDLVQRRVIIRGSEIKLTPTEYELLKILMINSGKVLTHRQLLGQVWGAERQEENQYLRIYISQLRRKIEVDPNRPRYILTEPGIGYRLIP